MRLVNRAAAKRMPATRRCASAWEETSIAQAVSPASRIRARSRCRSTLSGVVWMTGSTCPPTRASIVPMRPARMAGGLEDCAEQECGRGLAVGAGDADDHEVVGGATGELRRHEGHRQAGVAHLDLRHVDRERPFHQQGSRPLRDGLLGEVVSVSPHPAQAGEQAARGRAVRPVDDLADLRLPAVRASRSQSCPRHGRAELFEDHRDADATSGPGGRTSPPGAPDRLSLAGWRGC